MRSLGLIALGAALAACGGSPCGPSSAKVSRVVDGDTIELENGTKIRYLLVNAPETTNGHNDCYGAQAAARNAELVEGKTVELTYDTQCTDRYGRTLAYVKADGVEVNSTLLNEGLACVLYVKPDGMSRVMEFQDLEVVAKTNRVGLWGACSVVTCE